MAVITFNPNLLLSNRNGFLLAFALCLGIAWALVYLYAPRRKGRLPLPPGPPRKPIIGNALDIPLQNTWEQVSEWGKQYGDIVYVESFGQPIIYITNFDVAIDLLEKRSTIYSDRSDMTMLNELCGFKYTFGFKHYGDEWRMHRKIFHQEFNSNSVKSFLPCQEKHVHALVQHLRGNPIKFREHFKRLSTALILDSAYGIEINDINDSYVTDADQAMEYIDKAAVPGAWAVDTFPILRFMPNWVPGAGFKRKAIVWRKAIEGMADNPFLEAKRTFLAGNATPSFTSKWLDRLSVNNDMDYREKMEEAIRGVGASMYVAGFETTNSSLSTFILALVLHPEVQVRAQKELESVIGTHRMPEWSDLPDLPYINAVYKEVLRWKPVVPLGLPHSTTQEDVYKGMRIPKGCIVVYNSWHMLRDEARYGPDPDDFNPDRFMKPGTPNPAESFGFGRRICPGRHMVENTLLMAIASIFQLFTVGPKRNPVTGEAEKFEVEFSTGFLMHPRDFECEIRIRSAEAEKILDEMTK